MLWSSAAAGRHVAMGSLVALSLVGALRVFEAAPGAVARSGACPAEPEPNPGLSRKLYLPSVRRERWIKPELADQLGGVADAVAARRSVAYLANGPRLLVVDATSGANPQAVGRTPPLGDLVRDVVVSESYAYLAAGDAGLVVVDIASNRSPRVVARHEFTEPVDRLEVSSGRAYVGMGGPDAEKGLFVVDVGDPTEPRALGFLHTDRIHAIAASDGYVYLACGPGGLWIVDVRDPRRPSAAAVSHEDTSICLDVDVKGAVAFVTVGTESGLGSGLRALSVQDPREPAQVGFLPIDGYTRSAKLATGAAYVAYQSRDGERRTVIIDVRDPARMEEVGALTAYGPMAIAGARLYVADGGLRLYDVSDRGRPQAAGSLRTPGRLTHVQVSGDYLYAAESIRGEYGALWVVDARDPSQLLAVSHFSTSTPIVGLAAAGSRLYVAHSGLWVMDLAAPAAPRLVGEYPVTTETLSVAAQGDLAFLSLAEGGAGVTHVIDARNPEALRRLSSIDAAGVLAADGQYLYVGDSGEGLAFFDVSDPARPVLRARRSFTERPGAPTGIAVGASLVYLTGFWQGLRVIEMTQENGPVQLASLGQHPGTAKTVGVSTAADVVALAAGPAGIVLVDALQPQDPRFAGLLDTPGTTLSVQAAGGYLYAADDKGGLLSVALDDRGPTP